MTVGSLFSGIGGFDLGFQRAGFDITWQVEIDEYASRVLAKHWPDVTRYGDIRAIDWATVAPVDVICGGFPCQPHSVAGKRGGSSDERDLWPEYRRCLRDLKPRWVVAENVPGLLSNDAGRFFGNILGDLAALGYDAEWDCLPASAFGAPHRRDRVWLVAYPGQRGVQPDGVAGISARAASGAITETSERQRVWLAAGDDGADVADADEQGPQGRHGAVLRERPAEWAIGAGRASVADTDDSELERGAEGAGRREWGPGAVASGRIFRRGVQIDDGWLPEPDVGRVAHGVPARVDRLRGLGNAVVPQITEWIAHRIAQADAEDAQAVI